jgi:hypothetical protein
MEHNDEVGAADGDRSEAPAVPPGEPSLHDGRPALFASRHVLWSSP